MVNILKYRDNTVDNILKGGVEQLVIEDTMDKNKGYSRFIEALDSCYLLIQESKNLLQFQTSLTSNIKRSRREKTKRH